MMDLGSLSDAEMNSLIGDMNRQQLAQLLRARGTHAMFTSSSGNPGNSTPLSSGNPGDSTPLSSSLPLSASSRASSAPPSPPNSYSNSSSSSFWPEEKSVTLYTAPRGRTRPCVSVDGLKVETFLRVAGVR